MLDLDLPESAAWTTLAGLIIAELGTIPEPGAKTRVNDVDLEVVDATRRRIQTVRLRLAHAEATHEALPQPA